MIDIKTFLRVNMRSYLTWAIPPYRAVSRGVARLQYGGRGIISGDAANAALYNAIVERRPACFNRIGLVELDAVRLILRTAPTERLLKHPQLALLNKNAGVFPITPYQLIEYSNLYIEALRRSTHVGAIFNVGEAKLLAQYAPHATAFEVDGIDPFYWDHPWTYALEGRKVLVVSPFTRTIQQQLGRLDEIWRAKKLFGDHPDVQLVRAPLSGGLGMAEHDTWSHAVEDLMQQVQEREFDVLIAGCGAFAPVLCGLAANMGRVGVNLGGSTQIMFGIKGARWDHHPIISRFFNEHWVRPSGDEVPSLAKSVEGGCYW